MALDPPTFLKAINVLPNPEAIAERAAQNLSQLVRVVSRRGQKATVALSGGSTPKILFKILADKYAEKIDWNQLEIFFGDERSVPPDHPDSNFKTATDLWLSRVPIPEDQVHRMEAEADDLDGAAQRYEDVIRERVTVNPNGNPVFDLIWLGMGGDGHTASLFPGTEALHETQRMVVGNEVPQLQTQRMTFTYPLLNASSHVQFLVTGKEKAPIIKEISEGQGEYPSGEVAPTYGALEWLIDEAAAAEL